MAGALRSKARRMRHSFGYSSFFEDVRLALNRPKQLGGKCEHPDIMALSSEAYSTCVRRKFMRRNKSKIPSGPISSRSFAVQIASESISGAAGRGPKSSRDFVWLLRFTQIEDV